MLIDSLWAESEHASQDRGQFSPRAPVLIIFGIQARFQGEKLPCGTKNSSTLSELYFYSVCVTEKCQSSYDVDGHRSAAGKRTIGWPSLLGINNALRHAGNGVDGIGWSVTAVECSSGLLFVSADGRQRRRPAIASTPPPARQTDAVHQCT